MGTGIHKELRRQDIVFQDKDQALRDEYVLESFWRMQMTPALQFTPGVQLWFDPSRAPADDLQAAKGWKAVW